jgi:hypothetical protein
MKVKVFAHSGTVDDLEKDINAWLSSHKIKVDTIQQSYACDGKACHALVSVWFEPLEDINKI